MMKKLYLAGLLLLCLVLPFNSPAYASTFDHIVAFGDSLSDGGFWGAPATDDKVWVEYLADHLGATLDNRAIGGAKTTGGAIDLDMQVAAYLGGVTPSLTGWTAEGMPIIETPFTGVPTIALNDPSTLFSVWIGGNDSVFSITPGAPDARDAFFSTVNSIGALYINGARNFLIPNLPDVGSTPLMANLGPQPDPTKGGYIPPEYWRNVMNGPDALTQFCVDFNNDLDIAFFLAGLFLPDINLYTLDMFNIFNDIPIDERGVLFHTDGFHPSSDGHKLIMRHAADAIGAPVPEPATMLLFGLGLLGLAGISRRKK